MGETMTNSDFVLVPRIPTDEMISAGTPPGPTEWPPEIVWEEMLSASPVPPSEPVGWEITKDGKPLSCFQSSDQAILPDGYSRRPLYAVPPSPPRDEVVEALRSLLFSARLLHQNSEICIEQHHGLNPSETGWLASCLKSIESAEAVIAKLETSNV